MDVRQLRAEKAALGQMAEIRFHILHNHRKLDELEPAVADYLKANGTIRVSTKENLFHGVFTLDSDSCIRNSR